MSTVSFEYSGLKSLAKALGGMEKPQTLVTRAAKAGGKLLLDSVRAAAPVESGMMQGALKLVGERHRFYGKKGYQVAFDREATGLRKNIKRPGLLGGKRDMAYYPASVEYGYKAYARGRQRQLRAYKKTLVPRKKKAKFQVFLPVAGYQSRQVPGQAFMRNTTAANEAVVKGAMIAVLEAGVEKGWNSK